MVQKSPEEYNDRMLVAPDETCAKRRNETLLRHAHGMISDGYVPKVIDTVNWMWAARVMCYIRL